MADQKKLTHAQRGRLGGLAVARKTDMARLGSLGGATTVERYGVEHMTRLALRKNGYDVTVKTDGDA